MEKKIKDEIEELKFQMSQLEETAQQYRDGFRKQADDCITYYKKETEIEIENRKREVERKKQELGQILLEVENGNVKEMLERLKKVDERGK